MVLADIWQYDYCITPVTSSPYPCACWPHFYSMMLSLEWCSVSLSSHENSETSLDVAINAYSCNLREEEVIRSWICHSFHPLPCMKIKYELFCKSTQWVQKAHISRGQTVDHWISLFISKFSEIYFVSPICYCKWSCRFCSCQRFLFLKSSLFWCRSSWLL